MMCSVLSIRKRHLSTAGGYSQVGYQPTVMPAGFLHVKCICPLHNIVIDNGQPVRPGINVINTHVSRVTT